MIKNGASPAGQHFSRSKIFYIPFPLIILVAIVIVFFSCKKAVTKNMVRIKSLTYITNKAGTIDTTIYTATYDDQNRFTSVTKTTDIPGQPSTITTYTYQTSPYNIQSVVVNTTYTSLKLGSYSYTYYLDSQGYAISETYTSPGYCGINYSYIYDAQGYVTSLSASDTCGLQQETVYTYNADSNITMVARNFPGSVVLGSDTFTFETIQYSYTYLSGHQWPAGIGTTAKGLNSLGPNFLGAINNKMWTNEVITYDAPMPAVNTVTYNFQFDSLNRVRQVNLTADSGKVSTLVGITYQ